MPAKWDAERDGRLLKTIVKHFAIKADDLVKAFNADWNGRDEITNRAITQHIAKLNENAGGAKPAKKYSALPKTPVQTTPRTPKASKTPRTPASTGSKRKKHSMSDEEDEGDGVDDVDSGSDGAGAPASSLPRRESRSRSSKTARRTYLEESDADGESEMEDNDSAKSSSSTVKAYDDTVTFNHELDFAGGMSAEDGVESVANGINGGEPDVLAAMSRRNGIAKKLREFMAEEIETEESDWQP